MVSVERLTICFEVPRSCAPALKSALDDVTEKNGTKLEGVNQFAVEDAWTRGAIALGALRAAVTKMVPEGDPDYL